MFKSKVRDIDPKRRPSATEIVPTQPAIPEEMPDPAQKVGLLSCIGSGMSIVGKIQCDGPAQVYGRVEGELRASVLLICEGAQLEGTVLAQEVTVRGRVKGNIRAIRVRIQDGGEVEGDVFHRSLSIDENSIFQGSSRRVEDPIDLSSSVGAKGPQIEELQIQAPLAPTHASPSNEGNVQQH